MTDFLDTTENFVDESEEFSIPPDEWDALSIVDWFGADPGAPVPASARWGEYEFAHENPDAWALLSNSDFDFVGLTKDAGQLAITGIEGRANPYLPNKAEPRHMPGKHNQKTHGHGGGGYEKGKWQKKTGKEALIAKNAADLEAELPDSIKRMAEKNDGPDWATKMASSMLEDSNESITMYTNGPHTVIFRSDKVSAQQQKQFLADVDVFQTRFPSQDKMHISINPSKEFELGVGGETRVGTGNMKINERVFVRNAQGIKWDGMPASQLTPVTSSRYVLAHEWGHTHYEQGHDVSKINRSKDYKDGMSRYGKTAPEEAHAEAFAEWSLTKGLTDSPIAQAYADEFGWGERWL